MRLRLRPKLGKAVRSLGDCRQRDTLLQPYVAKAEGSGIPFGETGAVYFRDEILSKEIDRGSSALLMHSMNPDMLQRDSCVDQDRAEL